MFVQQQVNLVKNVRVPSDASLTLLEGGEASLGFLPPPPPPPTCSPLRCLARTRGEARHPAKTTPAR